MRTHNTKHIAKITNLTDLRIAKEGYKYEVKLREQAFLLGVNQFNATVKEAAKNTFQSLVQKLIFIGALRVVKSIQRK